jgi:hypothetical protein
MWYPLTISAMAVNCGKHQFDNGLAVIWIAVHSGENQEQINFDSRYHFAAMKLFNIVFIVLFVISAGLQYNDPDPYIWMPIYLFAAFLCYHAMQKKYNPLLYTVSLTIFSIYAIYLFFDTTGVLNWAKEHDAENIAQSMKATRPWIEETREFFGLVIIIIVMLINLFWLKQQKRKFSSKMV